MLGAGAVVTGALVAGAVAGADGVTGTGAGDDGVTGATAVDDELGVNGIGGAVAEPARSWPEASRWAAIDA